MPEQDENVEDTGQEQDDDPYMGLDTDYAKALLSVASTAKDGSGNPIRVPPAEIADYLTEGVDAKKKKSQAQSKAQEEEEDEFEEPAMKEVRKLRAELAAKDKAENEEAILASAMAAAGIKDSEDRLLCRGYIKQFGHGMAPAAAAKRFVKKYLKPAEGSALPVGNRSYTPRVDNEDSPRQEQEMSVDQLERWYFSDNSEAEKKLAERMAKMG